MRCGWADRRFGLIINSSNGKTHVCEGPGLVSLTVLQRARFHPQHISLIVEPIWKMLNSSVLVPGDVLRVEMNVVVPCCYGHD